MSNPIVKAIDALQKAVLATVKRRIIQEGPQTLLAAYNEFLQPGTVPDKKSKKTKKGKAARLYYSRPNTSSKLRTQYGNIQRALQEGETGNITEVIVDGAKDRIYFISGINENSSVQAGPDKISLEYARMHELGTSNFKKRPFLEPGMEFFIKEYLPDIMEQIERDLLKAFQRGS